MPGVVVSFVPVIVAFVGIVLFGHVINPRC
jgi:hypothetical protein